VNTTIWDDGQWPGLPALESDLVADVCVVGLGGSGLACVMELLARGRRVAAIDAGEVAGGAAGRNGGILRPGVAKFHHDAVRTIGRAQATRLYQMTLEEIGRIEEEAPGVVRRTGLIRVATSDEEYADCVRQRYAMDADGLRVFEYGGDLGRGISLPDAAAFQPLARARVVTRRALAEGAHIFERTAAIAIATGQVVTARARIRCDAVIVAVDGRLEALVPELRGAVRTARLQMLATAPPRDVSLPCPISLNYGFDYAQQLPDGSVAIGGGRDRDMEREWTMETDPTAGIQRYLEHLARDVLHDNARVTHRWAASVSYTDSGLPVFAEVRPSVWAIGGYCGSGNLMGGLAGRAAALAACGEPSEFASLLASAGRHP
jgi:glycine/D-amino acid oxidase-like deaminating enzyme